MVVRMTGSSLEYPGRNLGAAGFSLLDPHRDSNQTCCLPLPECRAVPSNQLFFFF